MTLMNLMEIALLVTLPEAIVCTWFGFVFFGLTVDRFGRRLLQFALLLSVIGPISLHLAPTYIHTPVFMALTLILLRTVFRELSMAQSLLLFVMFVVVVTATEIPGAIVATSFMGDPSVIRDGAAWIKIVFGWPFFGMAAAAAWYMQRKQYSPGQRALRFLSDAKNTPILYFIVLIAIQLLVMVIFFVTKFFTWNEEASRYLFYIGLMTIIVISVMAIKLIIKTREEAVLLTQNALVGDLQKVFVAIRSLRHDFANHVQVMNSMLTLGKHEQLKQYITELSEEIQLINRMTEQLPPDVLGSLIQSKTAIAADKKIKFTYQLSELPQQPSAIKNIDLVRIIGNLVDNAFDEAFSLPIEQRQVTLSVKACDHSISIRVTNYGKPFTEAQKLKLFAPGYSTKHGEHSGLGLYIVHERVQHYGGQVEAGYEEEAGIVFSVQLPLEGKSMSL